MLNIAALAALARQPGNAATIRRNWYRWFMNAPNHPTLVGEEAGPAQLPTAPEPIGLPASMTAKGQTLSLASDRTKVRLLACFSSRGSMTAERQVAGRTAWFDCRYGEVSSVPSRWCGKLVRAEHPARTPSLCFSACRGSHPPSRWRFRLVRDEDMHGRYPVQFSLAIDLGNQAEEQWDRFRVSLRAGAAPGRANGRHHADLGNVWSNRGSGGGGLLLDRRSDVMAEGNLLRLDAKPQLAWDPRMRPHGCAPIRCSPNRNSLLSRLGNSDVSLW